MRGEQSLDRYSTGLLRYTRDRCGIYSDPMKAKRISSKRILRSGHCRWPLGDHCWAMWCSYSARGGSFSTSYTYCWDGDAVRLMWLSWGGEDGARKCVHTFVGLHDGNVVYKHREAKETRTVSDAVICRIIVRRRRDVVTACVALRETIKLIYSDVQEDSFVCEFTAPFLASTYIYVYLYNLLQKY